MQNQNNGPHNEVDLTGIVQPVKSFNGDHVHCPRAPAAKQETRSLRTIFLCLASPIYPATWHRKEGVWQSLGEKEGDEMEGGHCVSELDRDQVQRDYCSSYTLRNQE